MYSNRGTMVTMVAMVTLFTMVNIVTLVSVFIMITWVSTVTLAAMVSLVTIIASTWTHCMKTDVAIPLLPTSYDQPCVARPIWPPAYAAEMAKTV